MRQNPTSSSAARRVSTPSSTVGSAADDAAEAKLEAHLARLEARLSGSCRTIRPPVTRLSDHEIIVPPRLMERAAIAKERQAEAEQKTRASVEQWWVGEVARVAARYDSVFPTSVHEQAVADRSASVMLKSYPSRIRSAQQREILSVLSPPRIPQHLTGAAEGPQMDVDVVPGTHHPVESSSLDGIDDC